MSENQPSKYHFFVDDKKFETDQTALTGLQIKAMANVPADYQLFLEGHGEDPDAMISDGAAVDFSEPEAKGVKKFYSVPPATFGSR